MARLSLLVPRSARSAPRARSRAIPAHSSARASPRPWCAGVCRQRIGDTVVAVAQTVIFLMNRTEAVRGKAAVGRDRHQIQRWIIAGCTHPTQPLCDGHVLRAERGPVQGDQRLNLGLACNRPDRVTRGQRRFRDRLGQRAHEAQGADRLLGEAVPAELGDALSVIRTTGRVEDRRTCGRGSQIAGAGDAPGDDLICSASRHLWRPIKPQVAVLVHQRVGVHPPGCILPDPGAGGCLRRGQQLGQISRGWGSRSARRRAGRRATAPGGPADRRHRRRGGCAGLSWCAHPPGKAAPASPICAAGMTRAPASPSLRFHSSTSRAASLL